MFNTSLRRAARSCPNATLPPRPTTPSIAPFTSHTHQRRHSSSKRPTSPNNSSSSIPASSVKDVDASKAEPKKLASESRLSKRKAAKAELIEEAQLDSWTASLPSVPSVQLNKKDLSIAAFYATYRPISITGPGPKEAQMEDIEKIFQPKPKSKYKSAQSEVIYTLSSALENLDQQIADKKTLQQTTATTEKADLIRSLTQHNDANNQQADSQQETINVHVPNGTVKLVIQEIKNRFRAYNVPPPPTPVSQQELDAIDAENTTSEANEESLSRDLEAQVQRQDTQAATARGRRDRRKIEAQLRQQQQSSFQARPLSEIPVAEVFQNGGDSFSVDIDLQNGHFFTPRYDAQNPATIQPTTSTEGSSGRVRRGFGIPTGMYRKPRAMRLISVKRQRRLKMKKHKYKKLMRKTRNLRRKQDRL